MNYDSLSREALVARCRSHEGVEGRLANARIELDGCKGRISQLNQQVQRMEGQHGVLSGHLDECRRSLVTANARGDRCSRMVEGLNISLVNQQERYDAQVVKLCESCGSLEVQNTYFETQIGLFWEEGQSLQTEYEEESQRRAYYQNIVQLVCDQLDRSTYSDKVCLLQPGSFEEPSDQVQQTVERLVDELLRFRLDSVLPSPTPDVVGYPAFHTVGVGAVDCPSDPDGEILRRRREAAEELSKVRTIDDALDKLCDGIKEFMKLKS